MEQRKKRTVPFLLLYTAALLLYGCASSGPLQGVSARGKKVYLAPIPVENSAAFQGFLSSSRTEVDKQRYLFRRLKDSSGLTFFHDGNWYNSLEAYRGGMWLMRNRYKKGQDTRAFIDKYVVRSETTGKYHLIKYPDGSVQIGSEVLLNELALLEETAANYSAG